MTVRVAATQVVWPIPLASNVNKRKVTVLFYNNYTVLYTISLVRLSVQWRSANWCALRIIFVDVTIILSNASRTMRECSRHVGLIASRWSHRWRRNNNGKFYITDNRGCYRVYCRSTITAANIAPNRLPVSCCCCQWCHTAAVHSSVAIADDDCD